MEPLLNNCLIYHSDSLDPYFNLATEQYLLKQCSNEAILLLWKNTDCIVFGRNQDIFFDCDIELMYKLNVLPVRRITGGGAVFHDAGNLNFSFIVPVNHYKKDNSMQIIRNALVKLGIPAEITGRNDIAVNNAKVSGNAFYSNSTHVLHHGTLLINIDLEKMEKLLKVDPSKLRSHGIRSVRSRVANLYESYPQYAMENYEQAIIKAFAGYYLSNSEAFESRNLNNNDRKRIHEIKTSFISDEWIFAHSLEEGRKNSTRFSWGTLVVVYINVSSKEQYVKIFSDTLYADLFSRIKEKIEKTNINNVMIHYYQPNIESKEQEMFNDIIEFIVNER